MGRKAQRLNRKDEYKDILAEYDVEYLTEALANAEKSGLWGKFFDEYVVVGGENLKKIGSKNSFQVGTHLSHFDYIQYTKTYYDLGILDDFPRITAGANLCNWFVRNVGLPDFRKCNVLITDRLKMEEDLDYFARWGRAVQRAFNQYDSVFLFPDAGRNWGKEIFRNSFVSVGKKAIKSGTNPDVVPVVFDYDKIIEKTHEDAINFFRGSKNVFGRGMYYLFDASSFFERYFSNSEKGGAYMWVGEPVPLNDIATGRNLCEKAENLENYVIGEVKKGKSILADYKKSSNN